MAEQRIMQLIPATVGTYALVFAQAEDGTWWWTQPGKFGTSDMWSQLANLPGVPDVAQRALTTEEKIMNVPDVFAEHKAAEGRAVSGSVVAK